MFYVVVSNTIPVLGHLVGFWIEIRGLNWCRRGDEVV